jgi:Ni,Fe-hydrogenase III small subunit
MEPTPGKKKTILFGKCMYQAHKDNPTIQEMIPIKGCPPSPQDIAKALQQAGIEVDASHLEAYDTYPGMFMRRYEKRPEFEESFYAVE